MVHFVCHTFGVYCQQSSLLIISVRMYTFIYDILEYKCIHLYDILEYKCIHLYDILEYKMYTFIYDILEYKMYTFIYDILEYKNVYIYI